MSVELELTFAVMWYLLSELLKLAVPIIAVILIIKLIAEGIKRWRTRI